MTSNQKTIGGAIAALLIFALVFYGMWHLKRWWNYTWGYSSQVENTICKMVKPEALIKPCK